MAFVVEVRGWRTIEMWRWLGLWRSVSGAILITPHNYQSITGQKASSGLSYEERAMGQVTREILAFLSYSYSHIWQTTERCINKKYVKRPHAQAQDFNIGNEHTHLVVTLSSTARLFANTKESIIYLFNAATSPELALAFGEQAFSRMIRFPTEKPCRM